MTQSCHSSNTRELIFHVVVKSSKDTRLIRIRGFRCDVRTTCFFLCDVTSQSRLLTIRTTDTVLREFDTHDFSDNFLLFGFLFLWLPSYEEGVRILIRYSHLYGVLQTAYDSYSTRLLVRKHRTARRG